MAYRKGDVVLVNYPYTDMTTLSVRPAVVICGSLYQSEQPDIIFSALTTNIHAATESLDYVLQDWQAAGLRYETAFKPVIATLEPSLIVHHIGSLTPRDLTEIETRLKSALEF
jgi:mRNA interferase MazF